MPTVGIAVADGTNYPVCRSASVGRRRLTLTPAGSQPRAVVPLTLDGATAAVLQVEGLAAATAARDLALELEIDDGRVLRARLSAEGVSAATAEIALDHSVADTGQDPVQRVKLLALAGYLDPEAERDSPAAAGTRYRPRTTAAALRAFEAGLAPIDVFVHLATSAKATNVPPFDLDLIRQLLSQHDPGLPTTLLLMGIFRTLVNDEDLEVALFAAEAMNLIEGRLNDAIEEIRGGRGTVSIEEGLQLMRLFYRLALLQDAPAIARFYMWEAFGQLDAVDDYQELEDEDFVTLIRIMAAIELHDLALMALDERIADHPEHRELKIELEFTRGNYVGVRELMHELESESVPLSDEMTRLIMYWRQP